MNESTWIALVTYHNRIVKKMNPCKTQLKFPQNIQSVLRSIPAEELELLEAYWLEKKETIHPFLGTKHPAPFFLTDTNFTSSGMTERVTGMAMDSCCCFVIEQIIADSAPGEVVQAVIAHELAHAVIFAKYHKLNLPLPALTIPLEYRERRLQEYPESSWHEEWFVSEILKRWGYKDYLLELWEVAVEDDPENPTRLYLQLKQRMKTHPAAMGLKPLINS